jgi:hypothetical protein
MKFPQPLEEEVADQWLRKGNPWEVARPEISYDIPFGGHTEGGTDEAGRYHDRWVPERPIRGVAYDIWIRDLSWIRKLESKNE